MTNDELKARCAELLSAEECGAVDWDWVQDLSIRLLSDLRSSAPLEFPIELVIPYLTEFERRRADVERGDMQRAQLAAYLRASEA